MTIWLLVIIALVFLWLALAPRTGQTALRTRAGIMARMPFRSRRNAARNRQVREVLIRGTKARRAASGIESPASLREFIGWLEGMSDDALNNFVATLDDLTKRVGLDLMWLMDNRATGEMTLVLRDAILMYALAIWHTRAAEPFQRLEAYLANPHSRENRAFAQKVFALLVEQEASARPPEMMLAPEKDRRKYVYETIAKMAEENQDLLIDRIQQTLRTSARAKQDKEGTSPEDAQAPSELLPPGTAEVNA